MVMKIEKSKLKKPKGAMLTTNATLWHMEHGNIFIHPFNRRRLRTNSYDVTLGMEFFREQPVPPTHRPVFNMFDPEDIKRHWGNAEKAILASDWMAENGPLINIRQDDRLILIGPGETILAHTVEFVGGLNCVTSEMRAKSSIGRISITVCKCAGLGSVGFVNRWTMEITNHFKRLTVPLVVGMPIAQIAFFQVDPLTAEQSYAATGGQYQNTSDVKEMIRNWSPSQLLPRFDRSDF